MRTISAQEEILLGLNSSCKVSVRVETKDAGGTWRDLSSYPGFDAVKTVSVKESVDDPHATADIVLYKRMDDLNLSPFMQASAPNLAFVAGAAFSASLLWLNRECRVSYAMSAEDEVPSAWTVLWHGRIDEIDPSGNEIKLSCRDLGGALAMAWVKKEYVYGVAKVAGVGVRCRYFEPQDNYVLNEYILPKGQANGFFYKVTSLGASPFLSAATEPAWPTGAGATVVSGNITFTQQAATTPTSVTLEDVVQQILTDFGSGVSLYTPVATSTNVNGFILPRGPLLEALRNLVTLTIGWDLRYKWDSGSSAFRFTLSQPTRTGAVSARTFGPADYDSIQSFKVTVEDIRNTWHGVYSDAGDLWPDGSAKRKTITVTDSASVTKYGEQWAEIIEDNLSPLDSAAEMSALLTAALNDCKEPTVAGQFKFGRGFPHVQLGDLYTFSPNASEHDTSVAAAVTEYSHSFDSGKLETAIGVRGQPSIGAERWIDLTTWRNGRDQTHRLQLPDNLKKTVATATAVVGGTKLAATFPNGTEIVSEGVEFEWHLKTTTMAGAPDSTTLLGVTRATSIVVADVIPGKTYYATAVPRVRNASKLVRGMPVPEISFVAGQANAAHMSNTYDPGQFPLNGDFETQMDPAAPPDHWIDTSDAGVWGTGNGLYIVSGSGAISGSNYLKIDLNYSTTKVWTMYTDLFPVLSGTWYQIKAWVQRFSGTTGDIQLWVYQYDNTVTNVGATKIYDITSGTPASTGAWTETSFRKQMGASTKYARVMLISSAGTFNIVAGLDRVVVTRDLSSANFIDYAPGTSDTTTSATFVSITGATTTISQTTLGGWYHIVIGVTLYSTLANTEVEFAVTLDGTQIFLFRFFLNLANCHTFVGTSYVQLAPATTGTHTVAVQWRRMSGPGTLHIDSNDWIKATVVHIGGCP